MKTTVWFYNMLLHPKYADGMADRLDPDQAAPIRLVWSGSALFVHTDLFPKYLGFFIKVYINGTKVVVRLGNRLVQLRIHLVELSGEHPCENGSQCYSCYHL